MMIPIEQLTPAGAVSKGILKVGPSKITHLSFFSDSVI